MFSFSWNGNAHVNRTMIELDISDLYCIFYVSFSHSAEEVCGAAGFVCAQCTKG